MGIYKKKDSPNYYCDFKIDGKERVVVSTGTPDKKLAEQIYIEKRSLHQKMEYGLERKRIRLAELMNDF